MKQMILYTCLCMSLFSLCDGRYRSRRRAAVAGFLGAITGAAVAASSYSDECYYREGPPFDFIYPGAPIYAYDYPTYRYVPVYASPQMRYSIYPSYAYRP